MQRAVAVIAPPSFCLDSVIQEIKGLTRHGSAEFLVDKSWPKELSIRSVAEPTRYVTFSLRDYQERAIEDYEGDDELDPEFRRIVHAQTIYLMHSNSIPLLRRVLTLLLESIAKQSGEEAWVDDETGIVERATPFLRRAADPDWLVRLNYRG